MHAMATESWRDAIAQLDGVRVRFDTPLASFTSFGIGGPADALAEPQNAEAAAAVWRFAQAHGLALTVLGGGTNVLVADGGLRGVVVHLSRGFDYLREQARADGSALWEVGAGCGTGKLVRRALQRGLKGPEVLAGVPGSMGGALIMNAGGREGELKQIVVRVQVVDQGEVRWLPAAEARFAYRKSEFPPRAIVLAAELALAPGDAIALRAQVKAAQARRRATQPLELPNAGSIFKNPPGAFAGVLIEQAGCKRWRQGGAEVSPRHANFIVNARDATAEDVLRLSRRVRDRVREHAHVELELEVKLLGDFSAIKEGR